MINNDNLEREGKCFVLHKGFYNDILRLKDEIILWHENGLSLLEQVCGLRYVKTIITESPYMICMYDRRDVFIFREGRWVNPDIQTFACSFDFILQDLLLLESSINISTISHKKMKEVKEKIKNLYEQSI